MFYQRVFFPPTGSSKSLDTDSYTDCYSRGGGGGGGGEISYWPDLGQVLTFGDLINYRWVGQNKGGGMMRRQNKR